MEATLSGIVAAVSRSSSHSFTKETQSSIRFIEGLGVEGDAHLGDKVKHRYLVRKNPNAPNLRQVHLIASETLDELNGAGFDLVPGAIGENVLTKGLNLLALPEGAVLQLGERARIRITRLRNPCRQLNAFREGLTQAVLERDESGKLIRKAGIMSVVINSGDICQGDRIYVELPDPPHRALGIV